MNRYNWIEQTPPDRSTVADVARAAGIPEAGAQMLCARELTDVGAIERYLKSSRDDTHDPFEFVHMNKAVDLVKKAKAEGRKVLVHGDYDADGMCGTAILYLYLKDIISEVLRFVPDRRKDGYGLSRRAADWAIAAGVGLFIAVDCGTSDADLIRELEAAGIDVIVCDHHEFPADGDYAGVMLNPVREGETYPFASLCGAGVALKLIEALHRRGVRGSCDPDSLVDLMALATVGDMASLTGENRYYVRAGLELMNTRPRVAIAAMKGFTNIGSNPIRSSHIAFAFAPRLNAPGRVSRAKPSLEILCEDRKDHAIRLASVLECDNERRKELTKQVQDEAVARVRALPDNDKRGAFVIAGKGWDEGVLGIAAARVVEEFGRPAVLMTVDGDTAKGSGRSVPGVHLKEALDKFGDCFEKYGGHAQAVGLTIKTARIGDFESGLDRNLRRYVQPGQGPPLRIDAAIAVEDCSMDLVSFLTRCEPFGIGNRQPVWKIADVQIMRDTCIVGNGHLKLFFTDTRGNPGEAIKFGWTGVAPDELHGRVFDLAVSITSGTYMGRVFPELRLIDLRNSGG